MQIVTHISGAQAQSTDSGLCLQDTLHDEKAASTQADVAERALQEVKAAYAAEKAGSCKLDKELLAERQQKDSQVAFFTCQ